MVDKTRAINRLIRRTTIFTGVVGVVLSPIPLADELIFVPAYGLMTARIARHHELGILRVPWKPVMATAIAGLIARAAVDVTVAYIPGVSAFANCVSAIALTQFFGRYVDGVCANPAAARAFSVKEILGMLRKPRGTQAASPGSPSAETP